MKYISFYPGFLNFNWAFNERGYAGIKSEEEKIFKNGFLSEKMKKEYLEAHRKNMKLRFTFHRIRSFLYHKWMAKKNAINDRDIWFEEYLYGEKMVNIYTNKVKYQFSCTEIKKIFSNALYHNSQGYAEACNPKNPYTNLFFNKETLYYIYLELVKMDVKIPKVLQLYAYVNFDIGDFSTKYASILSDHAIKIHMNEMTDAEIIYKITQIVSFYFPYDLICKNCIRSKIGTLKTEMKEHIRTWIVSRYINDEKLFMGILIKHGCIIKNDNPSEHAHHIDGDNITATTIQRGPRLRPYSNSNNTRYNSIRTTNLID
jgi:hypothetical protein